uniref:MITD1 C-terminal phospholipase D-like domain-containing protein n=1 Tax=Onchocerca volvulus TaxID=6282 RepID=A0A8R1U044_ONCVO
MIGLVMQSFIDKSKPILQKAVALDRDNKKHEAVENYTEGDDTIESTKEVLREKISKYLSRAEVLKGQTKPEILSVQQMHIMHNDTGFGYERIFRRCADNVLTEINVRDAYIMQPYQVLNFVRFCELFVLYAPNLKTIRLWTHYSAKAESLLQQLKGSLACRNIELDVCYDENFHDREIRLVQQWLDGKNWTIGYCEIGSCDLNLRKCFETSIDIFKFKQSQ